MRRIPYPLRCIFFRSWEENQAPLGSGMVWNEHFEECEHPTYTEPELANQLEHYLNDGKYECGALCPHYIPTQLTRRGCCAQVSWLCMTHIVEIDEDEGCIDCMEEAMNNPLTKERRQEHNE